MPAQDSYRRSIEYYIDWLREGHVLPLPEPFNAALVEGHCWNDREVLPLELMGKAAQLGFPNERLRTYATLARALRARRAA